MKQFLLLLAFVGFAFAANVQAQSCQGAKSAKAEGKSCHSSAMAAAKAASLDERIESRTCPSSGKISYVRRDVCPHSGNVSYADVTYDAASGKFVKSDEKPAVKAEAAGSIGSVPVRKSGPAKVKVAAASSDRPACCSGSGSCTKAKAAKAEASAKLAVNS